MATITVKADELPPGAAMGGKGLMAFLKLHALANGIKNISISAENPDGSYTIVGDAQMRVTERVHDKLCKCFRCAA